MSDLETFTDTTRERIKARVLRDRFQLMDDLFSGMKLSENEITQINPELGGKSVYTVLEIIRSIGINRIVEQETKLAIDKMAGKLLQETLNET